MMVLERRMNPKDFRLLVYIFGIILEIIGFGLLFAFDKTIEILHNYKIIYSLILIMGGYLMAISVRRR